MDDLRNLRDAVAALCEKLIAEEQRSSALLAAVHPRHRMSARNLVHYVTLRQTELRQVQLDLWRRGFSSLGRLEGHVLDALEQVRDRLDDALRQPTRRTPRGMDAGRGPTWDEAEQLLHRNTRELLGTRPARRHVYIMVTAPSAAEVDEAWVERLLAAGMNVLRINAAHEDEDAWSRIVDTARRVSAARGNALRIAVDLPGPKLRTVALAEGSRVVRWRPEKDELGRVVAPHVVSLEPGSKAATAGSLGVPDGIWARLREGDRLAFRDARAKKRQIVVTGLGPERGRGELGETAYVVPGTNIDVRRDDATLDRFSVGDVDPIELRLPVSLNDRFAVVRPGTRPPEPMPAIGCTLDAALAALRPGERVLFDDGHLEAVAESKGDGYAVLRVTYATGGRYRLRGEKGINLPDTHVDLPLLAEDDERALSFAARNADSVGVSFVRGADDVHTLYARLAELHADALGVILKIESHAAFGRLPAILLAALERQPVGVMIARGDLAIESGYERLAELQEEILWFCEAAHLPVVWATQVLDTQARTGRPSRAEVTDAAMSVRAECVMLNKGPYVAEAVAALDDILRRMEQHQYKKRSLYRRLHVELPRPRP